MEIERKWLLRALPTGLVTGHYDVEQSYLSIDPEIRVCRIFTIKGSPLIPYEMTIKGDGDLVREEMNFPISDKQYKFILKLINKPCIKKEFYLYPHDEYTIEVSKVDKRLIYAEVEFSSEKEAREYVFPFPYINEVTYQEAHKMKTYWLHTRC